MQSAAPMDAQLESDVYGCAGFGHKAVHPVSAGCDNDADRGAANDADPDGTTQD